jgi:hypothetical protein
MRIFFRNIIIAVLILVLFIPFYKVTIVPDWELIFIRENGIPIKSIRIDQIWKDYSLEFWSDGENSNRELESDSDGYIKLPARTLRVSVFGIFSSKIRNFIVQINPHASFGPHSYVICRGEYNCIINYESKNEMPQRVIVK